ncbi:hypothetical protein N2152v2_002361 [Parachlorella kessleri]
MGRKKAVQGGKAATSGVQSPGAELPKVPSTVPGHLSTQARLQESQPQQEQVSQQGLVGQQQEQQRQQQQHSPATAFPTAFPDDPFDLHPTSTPQPRTSFSVAVNGSPSPTSHHSAPHPPMWVAPPGPPYPLMPPGFLGSPPLVLGPAILPMPLSIPPLPLQPPYLHPVPQPISLMPLPYALDPLAFPPLPQPRAASVPAGRSPPSQPRAAANPRPALAASVVRSPETQSSLETEASLMQASPLKMTQLCRAAAKALERLEWLFPHLPGPLPQWLLLRLLTVLAGSMQHQVPGASASASAKPPHHSSQHPPSAELHLTVHAAQAAVDTLQGWSSSKVARSCGVMLEELKKCFLSGEALPADPVQAGGTVLVSTPSGMKSSWTGVSESHALGDPIQPAALAAAAIQLVAASTDLCQPCLPPDTDTAKDSATGAAADLPPLPPLPPAAIIEEAPPILRPFNSPSGQAEQLRSLAAQALKKWAASCRLAPLEAVARGGQAGSGRGDGSRNARSGSKQQAGQREQQQQQGQVQQAEPAGLGIEVGPSIDFGLQQVAPASGQAFMGVAAAVAAQWNSAQISRRHGSKPAGAGWPAGDPDASILDMLQLLSHQDESADLLQQQQDARNGKLATPSAKQPAVSPLLKLRPLAISNTGGAREVWVLGGILYPQLPHTLAVVDEAQLFLSGAGACHTLTIALSTADGIHRAAETGLLKQLLLLVLAVPGSSPAAAYLDSLGSAVATADAVPGSSLRAPGAAAPVAAAPGETPGGYKVFAVGREVTVALVRRAGEVRSMLSVEAKPFVAESLRRIWTEASPQQFLWGRSVLHGRLSLLPAMPAAHQQGLGAKVWAAGVAAPQEGGAAELSLQEAALKYRRLLLLEEMAMEQGIARYDLWNVRLRFAVLEAPAASKGPWRYTLWSPSHSGACLEQDGLRHGRVYRAPVAPDWLQPTADEEALRLLCQLEVPGLSEGRPTLVIGDTVYLRTGRRPEREIAATLVGMELSSCFLRMPGAFWTSEDVAPLLAWLPSLRGSLKAEKGGDAKGTFDGLVHVRFSFDRGPMASMHGALRTAAAMPAMSPCRLLPSDILSGSDAALTAGEQPSLELVAGEVARLQEKGRQKLNAEQRAAVAAVVCGAGRTAPFALFGPPGTGKTVTLVECALQLLSAHPGCRLLLCAPQNYSADLLCSALGASGLGPNTLLRLNDPRRPASQVKADVLPYCWHDEASWLFLVPAPAMLQQYAVVVATCTAAALLHGQGFTHVLIDEAGQALLPEALIPLTLLRPPPPQLAKQLSPQRSNGSANPLEGDGDANDSGQQHQEEEGGEEEMRDLQQVESGSGQQGLRQRPQGQDWQQRGWGAVLCGDPQQLGPVVHSPAAAAAGLGVSLLERWMRAHAATDNLCSAKGVASPIVQLVRNYRSHARLLDLPSRLFYKSTLLAAADPASVLPPAWHELHGNKEDLQARQSTVVDSAIPSSDMDRSSSIPAAITEVGDGAEPQAVAAADAAAAASHAGQDLHAGLGVANGVSADNIESSWEGEEEVPLAALANLLFYGVLGQQTREGEAASYFNPIEASVVVDLVQGLLGSGAGVVPDDIGVMATYRKQVQKVRLLLRERGLGAIRVGTVDDYQGQEERVIFITTVLSKPESLPAPAHQPVPPGSAAADLESQKDRPSLQAPLGSLHSAAASAAGAAGDANLGFWRNPKRFNVAITRAKALLVVVGHPMVLLQDPNWRELLSYTICRGVYRGAGAASLRARLGMTNSDADDSDGSVGGVEDGPAELGRFIEEIAERALLGFGDSDLMFPSTLDQMYDAYSDEMPGRIML